MEIAGFTVVVILWIAFGAALVVSQSSIQETWQWFRGLPLVGQVPLGILFLPLVAGMWIWETSRPPGGAKRASRKPGVGKRLRVPPWETDRVAGPLPLWKAETEDRLRQEGEPCMKGRSEQCKRR